MKTIADNTEHGLTTYTRKRDRRRLADYSTAIVIAILLLAAIVIVRYTSNPCGEGVSVRGECCSTQRITCL